MKVFWRTLCNRWVEVLGVGVLGVGVMRVFGGVWESLEKFGKI